jgi:dihydrofolate reductase
MKIMAIAVTSVDGYITKHELPDVGFASEADQAFFKTSLQAFDCSIMGAKTFEVSQTKFSADYALIGSVWSSRTILRNMPNMSGRASWNSMPRIPTKRFNI